MLLFSYQLWHKNFKEHLSRNNSKQKQENSSKRSFCSKTPSLKSSKSFYKNQKKIF